jgi:hypothetical protein
LEAKIDEMTRQLIDSTREENRVTRERIEECIRAGNKETREGIGKLIRMQGDGMLDAFTSEWKDGPRLFSFIPIPGKAWNPANWTAMEFRVIVWCEASRRPVPSFGDLKDPKDESKGLRGSETITLPREWVQGARKALKWSSWITLGLVAGGAPGLTGLVTATGGFISSTDANAFAAELARQQKALKELADAIPLEESKDVLRGQFSRPGADPDNDVDPDYGKPVEGDLKLIRFLRDEFKKQDPTWGGLEARPDGKFGKIWAHPAAP